MDGLIYVDVDLYSNFATTTLIVNLSVLLWNWVAFLSLPLLLSSTFYPLKAI